ncbi:hypothetical protein [Mycolicibacter hiberniae]|uniref:Uncharacterized protein n=1 Tax=Mycolicibacter hiberniae TaxID=29314 RepID=A0A7I7X2H6_9MYCO|nr:hypothetical protein [Mycolicibacter hiberniae]MCV7085960.1 hypothetical protein [Mycolicibacter hiberniae]ORV72006.1 hypothetical protein AWC09_00820 [Mycolicibacter hiberniae]BBZ24069.1 hypothetical protein MHIB_24870 [Mycolicibacter hiberniae]
MDDTEEGIDRRRTTRPRTGLVFKDGHELPALAVLLMATAALVGALCAAAQQNGQWTLGFGIVALVLAIVGSIWFYIARNRATHPAGAHHRHP